MKQASSIAARRVLLVGSVSVQAQQKIRATLTGIVQNSQGNVIPDASGSVTSGRVSRHTAADEVPTCITIPTQSQIF